MAIGQEENIFVCGVHIELWVMLQYFKVEGCKVICASQGTAGVTAGSTVYHTNNIASYLAWQCLLMGA